MRTNESLNLVEVDENGVATAFRGDVLRGLSEPQKAIPARWFYDTTGSALFEDITALPEYYPTRSETDLLRSCYKSIFACFDDITLRAYQLRLQRNVGSRD